MIGYFKTFVAGLFVLVGVFGSAQPGLTVKSLDANHPISFGGDHIVYHGSKIQLGPTSFYIDGQLTDEECAAFPYVFNSVNKAVEHLTDGTEETPMVLYIAPYVYWIDNPDDPAVRVSKDGATPYGLTIKCEWLRFYGLSDNAENVVLACNRGQTIGAQGNFTMLKISGQGTSSENITFGNYCNVDLVYPLKPALNREKRASAIVQAQLIHCDGDKIVARNTRFISRLNLCPFVGGKRVLFDGCHFESTDDALCGTAVYLNCTLDFNSSKPFYHTVGTGAVFLNCDIRSFTRGKQFFTKANGQVAVVDTRFTTETTNYLGWNDVPPVETCNYQYNVTINGKNVLIGQNDPSTTIDMSGKGVLNAYRFIHQGKVLYNTYNLLAGHDDWDPMQIKQLVLAAVQQNGEDYSRIPVQLLVTPTRVSVETGKNDVLLSASANLFGNYKALPEKINWTVDPGSDSLVELKVAEDGLSCRVIPTNRHNETRQVVVRATSSSGLQAASVLQVSPSFLDPPAFVSQPQIVKDKDGKLYVNYQLDMKFEDQSRVTWYRCRDANGSDPIEVAVSRINVPLKEYELSAGDIGYHIMASISPKHIRCEAGKTVSVVTKKPVSAQDVKSASNTLNTNFRNVSVRNQPLVIPGYWTFLQSYAVDEKGVVDKDKDGWYYGEGSDGAADKVGLLQVRNARMLYTPVGEKFGDMKLRMTVTPFKTAGQGFSMAGLYMDVLIKFDTKTMTGYALRFIRTTKYHDAVDCVFVKYENGKTTEISGHVSTSCYRPSCQIEVGVKGNTLKAHAFVLGTGVIHVCPDIVSEVQMETQIETNGFGGFGIEYHGGSPSMINEMSVEW